MKNGRTGFHASCIKQHDKIVHVLIEKGPQYGIDIDLKTQSGKTGLGIFFIRVCASGDIQNLDKLMKIKEKVNVNESNEHGETGFYFACLKGHDQVVKFLLENCQSLGLDLNKAKKNGMTGFHAACWKNHDKVVNLLLEKASQCGIDVDVKDNKGNTGKDLWPMKFLKEVAQNS